jgi:hypothetical protein
MERTEAMSEMRARDTLYGPHTRSGQVEVVEPPIETVIAVAAPMRFGGFRVVDVWADWDSISWDDPRPGYSVLV